MVQNSTDAFNGLMKSLKWKEGDVILLPNTSYNSVRNTVEWLRECYNIEILKVKILLSYRLTLLSRISKLLSRFIKRLKIPSTVSLRKLDALLSITYHQCHQQSSRFMRSNSFSIKRTSTCSLMELMHLHKSISILRT